jgi:class 3 adenylate cyclase
MSWVIENERTVFWETGEARDRLNCPLASWKGRRHFPCLLSIPLNARGKVIGSLTIEMKQRRALTESDFWALTALSNSIAVGLDNARLYRSEQTRRQLADNLLQASKAIGSDIKNLREVLDRILRQLYSVVKYDLASIQTGEPGEPRTIIYFDLDRTLDTTSLTLSSNSPEADIVHAIMRDRETILLNHAPQDARWRPDAPNWSDKEARSWIGSVLAVQDEVLGVLTVQFKEPDTYTDEDAEVVEAFAQHAAIALENARLYSEEAQRAEREKDEVRRIKALETLRTVTAHVPLPVVREIYRRRGDEPGDIIRHLDSVMAVADITGFTAMTEALNDAGQDGLEELTHLLNRYLSTMVNLAETHGGQVIGFGGDSLIVMWPVAEGNWIRTVKRAVHFALQMQAGMRAFTEVRTQKGVFTIDTRVGLSAGSIAEVHAGGIIRTPGVNLPRWIYMLMGPPLRRIAEAQRLAEPGQVVVAPEAWQMAASDLYGFEIENGFRGLEGVVWSANEFTEEPLPDWERLSAVETPSALEHLQYYVSHRLFNSDQEIAIPPDAFLDLTVIFVGLHGIDTIEEPDLFRLQDYVSAVEEVIYTHGGHINKVTAGEYGVEMLLYFDSQPEESHAERNIRATACVLEMEKTADRYNLRQRCGMDSGVIFMGTVGCATRRELTVIGTQVNIAARLMQGAEDGQQCLTETVFQDIDGHFTCKCLGEVQIKNIQSPVVIYTVSESAGQDFSLRLIPHQSESAMGR